jgi:eukaryotic-like serine/threonine-protein kinase
MSAQDAAKAAALIGRVVAGKYSLEALIGTGAMGTVFRAKQVALEKAVAIKILHGSLRSDPSFVERFHREAKAASSLDHPNSVGILDYGESDELLYIAMEFLDGRDLFDVLAHDAPLPRERIIDLMRQTLAAVAAAHELNIVHRDLKPENIMVLRRRNDDGDWSDVVKVCDFGVAKMSDRSTTLKPLHGDENAATETPSTSQAAHPQRHLSMQGALIGTPEYMSPEQAKGEPLDLRSDLYAMGVILYQLLTGKVPFEGATALEVALKHITIDPTPPSELVGDVDSILEAVCLKAMQKVRSERYQTARQFRNALRSAMHGLPLSTDWADATGVFPSLPPSFMTPPPAGADSRLPPSVRFPSVRSPGAIAVASQATALGHSGGASASGVSELAVSSVPSAARAVEKTGGVSLAPLAPLPADLMYFASDLPSVRLATGAQREAALVAEHAGESVTDVDADRVVAPASVASTSPASVARTSERPVASDAPAAEREVQARTATTPAVGAQDPRPRAPGARSTPLSTSTDSRRSVAPPKRAGTALYFLAPAVFAAAGTVWVVTNGKPASLLDDTADVASARPKSNALVTPDSSYGSAASGSATASTGGLRVGAVDGGAQVRPSPSISVTARTTAPSIPAPSTQPTSPSLSYGWPRATAQPTNRPTPTPSPGVGPSGTGPSGNAPVAPRDHALDPSLGFPAPPLAPGPGDVPPGLGAPKPPTPGASTATPAPSLPPLQGVDHNFPL